MAKIDNRDIYERLWNGRDFEIKHLWQRSVFLATFLVMVFTAYCGLWASFISSVNDDYQESTVTFEYKHEIFYDEITEATFHSGDDEDILSVLSDGEHVGISCCFMILSCIGCVFSLLWIFMAKGSKYWYERYETSIDYMHGFLDNFSDDVAGAWRMEELRSKIEHRWSVHVPIQGHLENPHSHQSIYSRAGSAYSMSKVNIFIGQFFYILWLAASSFHLYGIINSIFNDCNIGLFVLVFITYICLWILIVEGLKRWLSGWGYEKHQSLRKHSIFLSYIDGIVKDNKYKASLCNVYHAHMFSMREHWMDNKFFVSEKEYLDKVVGKHMKYDDIHRLELFLQEYDAPRFFPEGIPGKWKNHQSGIVLRFPIQPVDVMKIMDCMWMADRAYSIHYFADLGFIPELHNDEIPRKSMVCIITDDSGEILCSLEFDYVKRTNYSSSLEYKVIYSKGSLGCTGSFHRV